MKIGSKSPETILREALVVARDELKRVNDCYSCVRPDPFGVVLDALQKVPALPEISGASDVEKRIVGKLVRDLIAASYVITVYDGQDDVVVGCVDEERIYKALASTDSDVLRVSKRNSGRGGSFVYLVWGNDRDIISDYGMSIEAVIRPALDLSSELEGQ